MTAWTITAANGLHGRVQVPGDKSISHRALMLGSLAEGKSHVSGFLPSGDCLATLGCMRALGIEVQHTGDTTLTIHGRGLRGPKAPAKPLNCVRSGTTMRLLAGILAGQPFECTLTGDPQLLHRPMRRITEPLGEMGADIEDTDGRAPLRIRGRALRGHIHTLTVASAQLKSALLLAGLYADGPTVVRQCGPARDHTELMLGAMGAAVDVDGLDVTIAPPTAGLATLALRVPGDFSSAAFLLMAALLVPGSEVVIEGVGVNPTRTGLLDVLQQMGARIEVQHLRQSGGESVADLSIRACSLRGALVGGDTVVRMIDEFPIMAVAATQAQGQTVVREARELRVKETDRIATVVQELGRMGADIDPRPDGFVVRGPVQLHGATVDSHGDHRLGMALAVAGLVATGETTVENTDCIADSCPGFDGLLRSLGAVCGDRARAG